MSHARKAAKSPLSDEPEQIGFTALTDFLATDPDRATSFFKIYHRSSIEDLLYLEAELAELNAELESHARQDLHGTIEDQQCARSWKKLVESTNPRQQQKRALILKRRALMREYSTWSTWHIFIFLFRCSTADEISGQALIFDEKILSMPHPHHSSVEATRRWSAREYLDENIRAPVVSGRSAHRLDDENDLVTTRNAVDQDRMLRFVRKYLGVFFLVCWKKRYRVHSRTDEAILFTLELRSRLI